MANMEEIEIINARRFWRIPKNSVAVSMDWVAIINVRPRRRAIVLSTGRWISSAREGMKNWAPTATTILIMERRRKMEENITLTLPS